MLAIRLTLRPRVLGVPSRTASSHPDRPFTGRAFGDRELGITFKNKLQVLAIETSCDDTSVALFRLEQYRDRDDEDYCINSRVLFHARLTSNSAKYGGIHPIVALDAHHQNLGPLVQRALLCIEPEGFFSDHNGMIQATKEHPKPDLIAVTRGPGMRSNLSVGLELAKGVAAASRVPLVGVHHMQAHALTPRLNSVLARKDEEWKPEEVAPEFPFLTVLASGGHTMLMSSNTLTDHKVLAETSDIALGDFLDKAARAILPSADLKVPYGKALEDFAFGDEVSNSDRYNYTPPRNRGEELERKTSQWNWSLGPPLAESKGGDKSSRRMIYSFAGLLNTIQRLMEGSNGAEPSTHERRALAQETMRVAFEHLASRIFLHLSGLSRKDRAKIDTIVVSGGVAANRYLRHVLRSCLDARGYRDICLEFPPVELCTDNALMIAWAGLEMYDAGYKNDLDIQPIRKWSMDPVSEDGGILRAKRSVHETKHKEREEGEDCVQRAQKPEHVAYG